MFEAKSLHGRKLKKSFYYLISTFLAFLCANFQIKLTKSTCLARLDTMLRLARSANGGCDIVDCE